MMQALPNQQCPLCGKANACAPAASGDLKSPCWCTSVVIPAEVLALVPAQVRGKSCVCAACVAADLAHVRSV